MNFSIHIDDRTAKSLKKMAKSRGKTRNALIGEALHQYIESQAHSEWSEGAKSLAGADPDLIPFESHRKDLVNQDRDPFE